MGKASDDSESDSSGKEDAVRLAAMKGLSLLGMFFVLLVFMWPLVVMRNVKWAMTVEVAHITALIILPFPYLYIYRKALVPIRMLIMPYLNVVVKSEAIRNKEPTWYNKCSELCRTEDTQTLLAALKGSVRKDLKKKLRIFHERGITRKTLHSDFLSLSQDIPIIWSHVKRKNQNTDKSVVEEFIKRFLVVFMASDAYIDRYYDSNQKLCALGLFAVNQNTLSNSMYFCLDTHSQMGIWQYHHFCGLLRASAAPPDIQYINFYFGETYAKKLAGSVAADYRDEQLLNVLYPFSYNREVPLYLVDLKLDLTSLIR
uniref:Uncharacterized protein n=1 Tax=Ditylum brightwellii TaxID=49249 RepID=A0A6V2P028_9STRA|mmetsp:Transcript_52/g.52  ORF Transcript_52/g.52 Transcript_52/m.52 type:complete len:314 (+) Transcript_52:34-975(+)